MKLKFFTWKKETILSHRERIILTYIANAYSGGLLVFSEYIPVDLKNLFDIGAFIKSVDYYGIENGVFTFIKLTKFGNALYRDYCNVEYEIIE